VSAGAALGYTGTVALVLGAAYLLSCLVVFLAMRRPPPSVSRFMVHVPGLAWVILPMETLWTWANRGELEVGAEAPDFSLPTLDGMETVRLSSRRGRPVVLFFGSYTCPPFRRQMPSMNALYEPFRNRADFLFVYVEEAHATDAWPSKSNTTDGVLFTSPRRMEERVRIGELCASRMAIPFPILVDGIEDEVGRAYRAWPTRVYAIDKDGRVAFKSRPGPFGFEADEIRPALTRLLGPPAHDRREPA
jgi:thiol-disulfide isomerase/thioredoxin